MHNDRVLFCFLRLLGSVGRRKGASAVVCHVRRVPGVDGLPDGYFLTVGNVGHAEAVLCREGRVHVLTTKHTIDSNEEERRRLRKIDTFLTEVSRDAMLRFILYIER